MTDEEFARSLPAYGGVVILVHALSGSGPMKATIAEIRGKDFLKSCKIVSIPDSGWVDRLLGVREPIYIHDSFLDWPLFCKGEVIDQVNAINAVVKRPPVYHKFPDVPDEKRAYKWAGKPPISL